jgi:hypothetical protein
MFHELFYCYKCWNTFDKNCKLYLEEWKKYLLITKSLFCSWLCLNWTCTDIKIGNIDRKHLRYYILWMSLKWETNKLLTDDHIRYFFVSKMISDSGSASTLNNPKENKFFQLYWKIIINKAPKSNCMKRFSIRLWKSIY